MRTAITKPMTEISGSSPSSEQVLLTSLRLSNSASGPTVRRLGPSPPSGSVSDRQVCTLDQCGLRREEQRLGAKEARIEMQPKTTRLRRWLSKTWAKRATVVAGV